MTHEKPDHEPNLEFGGAFGPGPRETVADLLRHARQDVGQNVRSVSNVLRIRPAYLKALESGEFDRLPGPTYAIGFLRTYADYLGLDADEMVERFKAETQAAAQRTELIFPEPVAEGRIPGGAIILVSVILLALAYGGWFYLSQQGRTVADLIPAWPTETQTAPSETQITASDETETPAGPAEDVPAEDAPAEGAGTVTTSSAQASTMSAAEAENPEPEAMASEAAASVAAAPETPAPETPAPVTPAPVTPAPVTPAPVVPPTSQDNETPEVEPVTEPVAQDAPVQTTVSVEPQAETVPGVPESGVSNLGAPVTAVERAPTPREPATFASLVDRTVVIPAPPSVPETVIIPDDRSPRAYGGSNDESRITIRAVQDSWVQVRDSQNAILLTRVLRAGDSYRVPNVTGLTLLTGNAGGIELEVDGIRLPPVGPAGSVRRSIILDPAQLLGGTANR